MKLTLVKHLQDTRFLRVRQLRFSAHGRWCGVLAGKCVLLINTRTFRVARALTTLDPIARGIHAFCFSPESTRVFLGCSDGVIEGHACEGDAPITAVKSTESAIVELSAIVPDRFLAVSQGKLQYLDLQCLQPTVDFPTLYRSHRISADRRWVFLRSTKSALTRGSIEQSAIYSLVPSVERREIVSGWWGAFFHQSDRIALLGEQGLHIRGLRRSELSKTLPFSASEVCQLELTGDDRTAVVVRRRQKGVGVVLIDLKEGHALEPTVPFLSTVALSGRGNLLCAPSLPGVVSFFQVG